MKQTTILLLGIFLSLFLLVKVTHAEEKIIYNQKISWYNCGKRIICRTANGEFFQKDTVACLTKYAFGTKFRITYRDHSVLVICRDRGGFEYNGSGVSFDIASDSFRSLAPLSRGIIYAKVQQIK